MPWVELKKKLSDLLEIPDEVMLDLPRIVILGNLRVYVENHRGIMEYTSETVRVKVVEGEVEIHGEGLHLRNVLPEEIVVEGAIKGIRFC